MSTRPARIQHALEIYKSARHVRGLAVQKTSWEAGKLYEYQGVNGEGSDLARMKESLENRLRWIWEEDLEKSLKEAVDRLQ